MAESDVHKKVQSALEDLGLEPDSLEALASQLVWRVGRLTDDGPVTVRVGLAGSVALFSELPRLKTATDGELEAAVQEGDVRVEWVGHLPS